MQHCRCALALSLAGAAVLGAAQAASEPWPQRTVRVIMPLPPGSATDLAARLFAQRLAEPGGNP
jgi:tripartite-type tricarboxylate transporter receptor subunit TctC